MLPFFQVVIDFVARRGRREPDFDAIDRALEQCPPPPVPTREIILPLTGPVCEPAAWWKLPPLGWWARVIDSARR